MPLTPPGGGECAYFRATSIVVSPLFSAGYSAVTSVDASPKTVRACVGHATVDTTPSLLSATFSAPDMECAALGSVSEHGIVPSPHRPLSCGSSQPPAMVVLTQAEPPYAILWASPLWLDVCGFTMPDIVGSDFRCIQGPATDRVAIKKLMAAVQQKQRSTIPGLVNYDKRKRPFMHTLTVFPVAGDLSSQRAAPVGRHVDTPAPADISMFRAESTDVSLSCGGICSSGPPSGRIWIQKPG